MTRKKTAAATAAAEVQPETAPPVQAVSEGQPPPDRPPPNGDGHAPAGGTTAGPPAEQPLEGNGEKRRPVYKVGPVATDKDNSVEAAVWDRVIRTRHGAEVTVYSVTVQANWRDGEGTWKTTSNFRGGQVYALLYCLQRASDWILAQRDPANDCPF